MSGTDRGQIVMELVERYYERVYRFARRSADQPTAEDVVQEVFTRLLNSDGLERKSITVSYLIKIADNLLKRRYRQVQRREQVAVEWSQQASAGRKAGADVLERLECEEQRGALALAQADLGSHEQAALRFIVGEGMSYHAAAASLGVNVTSVNNWKYRGIQRLKKHDGCGARGPGRADDARRGGGVGQRAS